MNHSDYYGFPTGQLSNSFLTLDYLTSAGPRIVRLTVQGDSRNLLFETPDTVWPTPNGPFRLLGGHRLWKSPESREFTYIPDSSGLSVEETPHGVRLIQTAEPVTKIQKSLEISLEERQPVVHLHHKMTNLGTKNWTFALWALTMLPLGGTATIPLPAQPADPEHLLPNRNLVLWPYTRINDARLHLADDKITLGTSSDSNPVKLGVFIKDGRLEYLKDGILFTKRTFSPESGDYPDRTCNLEVYTNHQFIELETIGSLVTLKPGETAVLKEDWTIQPIS
jgi:hypothetical protein